MKILYLSDTNIDLFYVYDKYYEVIMEISFQLLQQQNHWWFREEVILDDEKIADYDQETYQYIPPILSEFPENTDAILTPLLFFIGQN